MKFSWLACPSTRRMCTWIGDTKRVVVTGLEGVDLGNVPLAFDLPARAVVHEVPSGVDSKELATQLGGVEFTVFARSR